MRSTLRYLPWIFRDLALAQGVVLTVAGVFAWLIMTRINPMPDPASGPAIVKEAVARLSLPFLLYCCAAIVSTDRALGYYRTFFSRPLSPPWYYLLRWLLGGIIFLLITPVLTLGLSAAIGGFPLSWEVMGQLGLSYLLLGGLIFFFSPLVRHDWLLGMVVLMMQGTLHALQRGGVDLPSFWDFVYRILPPIYQASLNEPFPHGALLTHIVLYGAGLVASALLLLRLRPLGSGGRS